MREARGEEREDEGRGGKMKGRERRWDGNIRERRWKREGSRRTTRKGKGLERGRK